MKEETLLGKRKHLTPDSQMNALFGMFLCYSRLDKTKFNSYPSLDISTVCIPGSATVFFYTRTMSLKPRCATGSGFCGTNTLFLLQIKKYSIADLNT